MFSRRRNGVTGAGGLLAAVIVVGWRGAESICRGVDILMISRPHGGHPSHHKE